MDATDELLQQGLRGIDGRLERFLVSKGKMTSEDKAATMKRIRGFTAIEEAVKGIEYAIEAVPERMALKIPICSGRERVKLNGEKAHLPTKPERRACFTACFYPVRPRRCRP